MAPSQEKYYSAEFGKLRVHFNITQPRPVTRSQTIRNQQSKKRRRPQLSEALDPMRGVKDWIMHTIDDSDDAEPASD
ncbi:hypothetical protein J3459_011195 [Metarhizium acridum]|nr:hypothetical protein J3459_011195 [Metarhizium acridum]